MAQVRTNCGGEGGWTITVAYVNMTEPVHSRLALLSHWQHVSDSRLREMMGSSEGSPDMLCSWVVVTWKTQPLLLDLLEGLHQLLIS